VTNRKVTSRVMPPRRWLRRLGPAPIRPDGRATRSGDDAPVPHLSIRRAPRPAVSTSGIPPPDSPAGRRALTGRCGRRTSERAQGARRAAGEPPPRSAGHPARRCPTHVADPDRPTAKSGIPERPRQARDGAAPALETAGSIRHREKRGDRTRGVTGPSAEPWTAALPFTASATAFSVGVSRSTGLGRRMAYRIAAGIPFGPAFGWDGVQGVRCAALPADMAAARPPRSGVLQGRR